MVFSSIEFIFFFLPVVLLLYFMVKSRPWRNTVLLITSLFFYAWGEPIYVLLMVVSIICNWGMAILIHNQRAKDNLKASKGLLILSIALNLLLIGFFKYSDFIINNINGIISAGIPTLNLPLPIGISFFTFQVMSYVIDVYRGDIKLQKNPAYVGAYITMFPQLIAGPIVRFSDIAEEMENRVETLADFSEGIRFFAIGLAKKVLIANTMARVANAVMDQNAASIGMDSAWIGIIAYTFQIYFDFSGYSDMAIGMGRMFGFHFHKNFDYPYISRSITEFWRRWHISLGSFFRDYVYIPLGGNRVSKPRWLFNIMVVWCLTGLWHGASWNYVLWGLYFGLLLIVEKLLLKDRLNKMPAFFGNIYAILFFVMGWVIFRTEDVNGILPFFGSLFGAHGLTNSYNPRVLNILQVWPWFVVAAVCSTPLLSKMMVFMKKSPVTNFVLDFSLIGLLALSVVFLVTGTFNPFIYFRF